MILIFVSMFVHLQQLQHHIATQNRQKKRVFSTKDTILASVLDNRSKSVQLLMVMKISVWLAGSSSTAFGSGDVTDLAYH